MEDPRSLATQLKPLVESNVITTNDANLRSKMDSLIRSIENLEHKKHRIDFELKRQKRSLARKRMELKKVSKHLTAKTESAYDAKTLYEKFGTKSHRFDLDDRLLRESARLLDD